MSGLISVDEALALIEQRRPIPETETIALDAAHGRTLANAIMAQRTHPPQSMSAMDGYAVRLADVSDANAQLRVIGEAPAGRPFDGTVTAGEAVRIFTGGVIPPGADHVIIQENTTRDADNVTSLQAYTETAHIRRAGIDFHHGDTLVEEGTTVRAEHLSIAAASNTAAVDVTRRLRVGIFANGDELKPPGSTLSPGEIINSNPYGLKSLIEQWGAAQLQSRFEALAGRDMRSRDFAAWAAVRAIGEAVTRTNAGDVETLRAYIMGPDFELAGFKGRPLTYRSWNGQLRQPIPLVHARAPAAQAPLEGFLHQRNELDTLGLDAPESACEAFGD